MRRFTQILFPVDFSDPCARTAKTVAAVTKHFNATLTLLHAVSIPLIVEMTSPGRLYFGLRTKIQEASAKSMDRFVARHFASQALTRVVEEGDPAQLIVDYARQHKIDLIMMPTHGFGPFRRFLTGSVTAKVLHDAVVPLWTSAHSRRVPSRAAGQYRDILCAVDCNSDAIAVMRWAAWLGRQYKAHVKLVHVIPALNESSQNRGEVQLRRYLLQRAQEQFEVLIGQAGFRGELIIRGGNIPARLAETARQQHSDLLIVGRGHSVKALGRLRTHSLAILRESPCAVISI